MKSNGTWVSEDDIGGRRVAVISTGGTIASVESEAMAGLSAALPIAELLDRSGAGSSSLTGPVVELAGVNSWNVDPPLMWEVAAAVHELTARPDVAGVVVTHGTDTLEETAFLVDVLSDTDKPVVFTAAMRSADDVSPDGPRNLRSALRAAACPALRGMGTLVCLGEQLHAARWARKWHTHSTAAFDGKVQPVATVDPDGTVRRILGPLPRWTVPGHGKLEPPRPDDVPVLHAYTGMSSLAGQGILSATSPRGLVLEGFGLGHVPAGLVDPIRQAISAGIVVVVATRVPAGGTWSVYGGPGGGTDLTAMGVVSAGDLSAGKARLLLLACLADNESSWARKLFEEAVAVLGRGAEGAYR